MVAGIKNLQYIPTIEQAADGLNARQCASHPVK